MGMVPEQSGGTMPSTASGKFVFHSGGGLEGSPWGADGKRRNGSHAAQRVHGGAAMYSILPPKALKQYAPREPTPLGVQMMEGGARVGSPEGRARRGEGCRFGCRSVAGWRGD